MLVAMNILKIRQTMKMNKYKRRHGKIIIKSELSLLKFEELDDMSKALVKMLLKLQTNHIHLIPTLRWGLR